jgi:neutral ceramidase
MKAGLGSAPITPTPPVYLAGFGDRTKPAEEVKEDLEALALYLSDGSTALCLVVCDLLGMTPDNSTLIRDAVADELGGPRANVILACTHTHSGPSLIAGSEAIGWPILEGYLDVVRTGCVGAASAARDASLDTTLRFVRAPLPDGFGFNRRGGDFDTPTFSVLFAPDAGIVANIGIHPVLLGPQWMAVAPDWVGPFRRELESLTGVTAIELTGALGDINPVPPSGKPDETYAPWASYEQTVEFGKRLARVVAGALPGAEPIEDRLSVVREETFEVPVGGTGIATLYGRSAMDVELVEWAIGDVRLVSIPGEAFHALGREISTARGDRVLLAGLSPWQGYLPHPYGEGYEEGVSYGPEAVAAIREALLATSR